MVDADLDALDELCADELSYAHSNGARDTKAEYFGKVRSGYYDYHRIDHPVERVEVVGDTAIVVGRMTADLHSGGVRKTIDNLALAVWAATTGRGACWPTPPPACRTDAGARALTAPHERPCGPTATTGGPDMANRTGHDGAGPVNLTDKLLGGHLVEGERARRGRPLAVDQILIEDATGTMAGCSSSSSASTTSRCRWQSSTSTTTCCRSTTRTSQDHRTCGPSATATGCRSRRRATASPTTCTLSASPARASLLVGADSHTTTAGAVGMFAIGAGGLEVAVAMAGYRLRPAVSASGRRRADRPARPWRRGEGRRSWSSCAATECAAAAGAVFEFFGDGVATLVGHRRARRSAT